MQTKLNGCLITVVVPIYNVEKYLPKCIDSILNQTFKNIEVILVNDGSTDGCGKICDDYANKDERIRVIHKENGGLSSARNAGIEAARGEFIGFIDSDDWIEPGMYESLLNIIDKYDVDIAQCRFINAPNEEIKIQNEDEEVKVFNNYEGLGNLYNDMYVYTVIACNKLYRLDVFKNTRYPIGKIFEDEGTTYKLIYNAKKIAITNQTYYYYRHNENSITKSSFSKKKLDILYIYNEKLNFMKNINNEELYAKTMKWYFYSLMNVYYKCQEHFKDDKEVIDLVKEKIDVAYKEYIRLEKKETKWVILLTLFKKCPSLYNKLIYSRN